MRDPRQKFSYKSLFSLFFTVDESGSRILPFFRIKWQNEMWRKIITGCSRKNGTNIRKPECIRIIWFPLTEWAEFRERRHRVGSFALSNPDGSETWIWHQKGGSGWFPGIAKTRRNEDEISRRIIPSFCHRRAADNTLTCYPEKKVSELEKKIILGVMREGKAGLFFNNQICLF